MNNKKEVAAFKKKYNVRIVNSNTLCDVLSRQGYTIIEFNGIAESPDVADLIAALHLEDQISHSRCFTYQDDKNRLLFVHEDLNEEERTIALAHEEGHIWCGHMARKNVFGEDVVQEHEANEFSHYLLKDRQGKRKKKIAAAIIVSFAVLFGMGIGIYTKTEHEKKVYTDDLYRTESGTKYHIRDCIYIKHRPDVFRLKKKELESGEYEPCEVCMPDKR